MLHTRVLRTNSGPTTHLQEENVVELLLRVVVVAELTSDGEFLLAGLVAVQIVRPKHHFHQGRVSEGSGHSLLGPLFPIFPNPMGILRPRVQPPWCHSLLT